MYPAQTQRTDAITVGVLLTKIQDVEA